jgi:hypothetical protein
MGGCWLTAFNRQFADVGFSVLEYQNREDAERAVKQLDGKDLRGQTVRVLADQEVRLLYFACLPDLSSLYSLAWSG